MGNMCVVVSVVHPVAILSVVFCVTSSLLMFVSDASGDERVMGVGRQQRNGGGESDLPACGSQVSFSVHLSSNAVIPAGFVHKSK